MQQKGLGSLCIVLFVAYPYSPSQYPEMTPYYLRVVSLSISTPIALTTLINCGPLETNHQLMSAIVATPNFPKFHNALCPILLRIPRSVLREMTYDFSAALLIQQPIQPCALRQATE